MNRKQIRMITVAAALCIAAGAALATHDRVTVEVWRGDKSVWKSTMSHPPCRGIMGRITDYSVPYKILLTKAKPDE